MKYVSLFFQTLSIGLCTTMLMDVSLWFFLMGFIAIMAQNESIDLGRLFRKLKLAIMINFVLTVAICSVASQLLTLNELYIVAFGSVILQFARQTWGGAFLCSSLWWLFGAVLRLDPAGAFFIFGDVISNSNMMVAAAMVLGIFQCIFWVNDFNTLRAIDPKKKPKTTPASKAPTPVKPVPAAKMQTSPEQATEAYVKGVLIRAFLD